MSYARNGRLSGATSYTLKYGPDPKSEYVATFDALYGGLNLKDLDFQLSANESPDMLNLNWNDGVLSSRDGQRYIDDYDKWKSNLFPNVPSFSMKAFTCFEQLYCGFIVAHINDKIVCFDTEIPSGKWNELYSGVPPVRGTFFRFQEDLMYKTKGAYIRIKGRRNEELKATTILAEPVEPYVPITALNCDAATGGGDTYQPVNRLTLSQKRLYNASEGVKDYLIPELPVLNDPVVSVKVDGAKQTKGVDYTGEYREDGYHVLFANAPPVADPPTNNTVEIEFKYKSDNNYESINSCRYAAVYGGDTNISIVLGGCTLQPNAYFWSGNDSAAMNAGYFPDINYNFAGDSSDAITGFGKQQNLLVVFKRDSIGKATYGLTEIDGRANITMDYVPINAKIGCDLPWTIQLVENNLVFCHSKIGACLVLDSSSARENNIVCISEKINGTDVKRGLLTAVSRHPIDSVCSVDTDGRYIINVGGEAFEWDYTVSTYQRPSWFRHTNVGAVAFWQGVSRSVQSLGDGRIFGHINSQGRVTIFERIFMDYGEGIEKIYTFPTMTFGTYDRLKNVNSVLFSVRNDMNSDIHFRWSCDYCDRDDPTPCKHSSWRLVPRDLSYRDLTVARDFSRYAFSLRRKPGFKHIRHFAMRLTSDAPGCDMALVTAQVFYNFQGRDR